MDEISPANPNLCPSWEPSSNGTFFRDSEMFGFGKRTRENITGKLLLRSFPTLQAIKVQITQINLSEGCELLGAYTDGRQMLTLLHAKVLDKKWKWKHVHFLFYLPSPPPSPKSYTKSKKFLSLPCNQDQNVTQSLAWLISITMGNSSLMDIQRGVRKATKRSCNQQEAVIEGPLLQRLMWCAVLGKSMGIPTQAKGLQDSAWI